MITFEEIESLKPLAASRGFSVSAVSRSGGRRRVGLHQLAVTGEEPALLSTFDQAASYLRSFPELPRFKVRATYTEGQGEEFELYAADRREALIEAASHADIMAGLRPELGQPAWQIRSLEVL